MTGAHRCKSMPPMKSGLVHQCQQADPRFNKEWTPPGGGGRCEPPSPQPVQPNHMGLKEHDDMDATLADFLVVATARE